MSTLNEVQLEVNRQIIRDFGGKPTEDVEQMLFFGLAEEAGEVVGLMKRVLRDFPKDRKRSTKENFIDEMGDVLWYLTACCWASQTSLEEIWEHNKTKLEERYGK